MRVKNALPTLLLFVVSMVCANHAAAVPIKFEFTGIGAGTLYRADLNQTISFQNTLVGATFFTDTADLLNPAPNLVRYGNGAVTGSFSVAGFSMGDFANTSYVFQNTQQPVPVIGFGDSVDFDIFGIFLPGLSYNLQSALATTVGATYFPGVTTIALANGNNVVLTEMHGSPNVHPSFTATLGTTTEVPESVDAWLFLVGLAGVAVARRGKSRVPVKA